MEPDDQRSRATPGPSERRGSSASDELAPAAGRIAVASDLRLLAETISAALRSRGFDVAVLPWLPAPSSPALPTRWAAAPDALLLVCDLDTTLRTDEARLIARRLDTPWLVMARGASDPAWGAMLEAGADAVIASSISLDELVESLVTLLRGESPMSELERVGLLREWREAELAHERLVEQITSLSPREQAVLSMLYEGTPVRAIAERFAVSEATVRSQVKALLRKLAVNSQLAAVAAIDQLRERGRQPPRGRDPA